MYKRILCLQELYVSVVFKFFNVEYYLDFLFQIFLLFEIYQESLEQVIFFTGFLT